jgi:hypothetical protein
MAPWLGGARLPSVLDVLDRQALACVLGVVVMVYVVLGHLVYTAPWTMHYYTRTNRPSRLRSRQVLQCCQGCEIDTGPGDVWVGLKRSWRRR